MRRELIELQSVVGQPLQFTIARDDGQDAPQADPEAPGLRVRASVEDAPAPATPRVRPDAS
jgi:hypothetical protein